MKGVMIGHSSNTCQNIKLYQSVLLPWSSFGFQKFQ